jgi:hypothetical protein
MRYDVRFIAELKENKFDLITELTAPIQTLCPCSKEISDNGAHNQRAHARIAARMKTFVWIEELAEIADKCASAPVYSILKREDEKAVTERAYANPRFVEDSVRELAIAMENDHRITWYSVSVRATKAYTTMMLLPASRGVKLSASEKRLARRAVLDESGLERARGDASMDIQGQPEADPTVRSGRPCGLHRYVRRYQRLGTLERQRPLDTGTDVWDKRT